MPSGSSGKPKTGSSSKTSSRSSTSKTGTDGALPPKSRSSHREASSRSKDVEPIIEDNPKRSSEKSSRKKDQTWTENELLDQLNASPKRKSHQSSDRQKSSKEDSNQTQKDSQKSKSRKDETPEERAERKRREKEMLEGTGGRSGGGGGDSREKTDEERRHKRKDETPEERAERKRLEREARQGDEPDQGQGSRRRHETEEERAERKRRERAERDKGAGDILSSAVDVSSKDRKEKRRETSEERAERKRRERKEREIEKAAEEADVKHRSSSKRQDETPEERHERKRRERAEREKAEAEKEKEMIEAEKEKESREERHQRKKNETPEERAIRKEKERAEKDEKRRKEKEKSGSGYTNGHASKTSIEEKNEEGEDEYDYENDFEEYNYDEDFDDDEDEEIDAPDDVDDDQDEPMNVRENKFSSQPAQEQKYPEAQKTPRSYSQYAVVNSFNFGGAKKSLINDQLQKRSFALLNRIELDRFSVDLFEMSPMSEYEMFMKKFGFSDTSQAACQTRDDDCDFSMQTEIPDLKESWTQFPPSNIQKPSGTFQVGGNDQETSQSSEFEFAQVEDSRKLSKFLLKSGQVMSAIIESSDTIGQVGKSKSYFEVADTFSYIRVDQTPLLDYYEVFTMVPEKDKLFVGFKQRKAYIPQKGLICVYMISALKRPIKYLTCSSELTCVAAVSGAANIVCAGSQEGIVYMWELNALNPVSKVQSARDETYSLIYESYSTALYMRSCLFTQTHKTAVVKVEILGKKDLKANHFQIASLDDSGVLLFWTYHSSEGDEELTLLPGGSTKFTQSHFFDLSQVRIPNFLSETTRASNASFRLDKPSVCLFATDSGPIISADCFSDLVPPKLYNTSANSSPVTCLSICPCSEYKLFVTADTSGVLNMYRFNKPNPIMTNSYYAIDSQYLALIWDPMYPLFIFAMTNTNLLVIDVTKFSRGPIYVCPFEAGKGSPMQCCLFKNPLTNRNIFAVHFEVGEIEFHDLLQNFGQMSSRKQKKKLEDILNKEFLPLS